MSQVAAIKFAHPVLHRLRSLWPSQLFRQFVPTGPVEWTLLISITLLSAWLMHMMLPLTLPFEFPAIFGYDILPTPDKVYEWSNIRHPLRSVLTYPLSIPFHLSGERYFAIQYSVCVAYGYAILFLYRIILSAGGRNIPYALLSVALFLSFGHSEILMFAPDTFSFSMSLLSLAFLWIWMKKEKNVVADNLLMALIAGMTVTNSLKLGILFLFTEKGFIKGLRRFLRALPLFIILSLPYIWTDIIPMLEKPGETSLMSIQYILLGDTLEWVYSGNPTNTLHMLWDRFWCEPLLLHPTKPIGGELVYSPSPYNSPYPNIIAGILLLFTIYSILRNGKDKTVWMIVAWISADLMIATKYNPVEAHIFCGHWLFLLPVLFSIGHRQSNDRRYPTIVIAALTVVLYSFNIPSIYNFFHLSM